MRLWRILACDLSANRGNTKGKFIMIGFRVCSAIVSAKIPVISWIFHGMYKFCYFWILNIEIPLQCKIGPGLCIWHGYNIVLNSKVVIGDNVVIRQGVTIGNRKEDNAAPRIGSNVNIGCNAVIIGDVTIGDGAKIGALTLVNKDVLPGKVCVGKGSRIL